MAKDNGVIVKYSNDFNTIPLRKLNAVEQNILMTLMSYVKNGENTVSIAFSDLQRLSKYSMHQSEFLRDVSRTYKKLMQIGCGKKTHKRFDFLILFTRFSILSDLQEVEIALNPEFREYFQDLTNWTRFSLQQHNELTSKYSKTMFRLLKQFRTTGKFVISIDDFRDQLSIPNSYSVTAIDKRVIGPIRQELTAIFQGLAIKKKYGKGRGKPVIGYQFTFKPEIKQADDFNKHAPTKEEQNRALTQADKQKEYEQQPTTLDDKILEAKRKIELLEQLKELEKEDTKNQTQSKNDSSLSEKEKQDLLSGLQNFGSGAHGI